MSLFKKAEKKRIPLKIALTGPSGSGKTFSALAIAKGMGGKIAVLDTENGSASLYSDRFDFDVVEMSPPFLTEKYATVVTEAEKAGYDILIIDSITHAWAGEGGLLEQKEAADARGGKGEKNKYANWAAVTKKHEAFKSKLLHSKIHVICTMRSKQDYVLDADNKPKKVGMAPIQRDGMEYEFTCVFDMAADNSAAASKDRTGLYKGKIFTPTEETGAELMVWRANNAIEVPPPPEPKKAAPVTEPAQTPAVSTEAVAKPNPPEPSQNVTATPPTPNTSTPSSEPTKTTSTKVNGEIANEAYKVPFDGAFKGRLLTDIPTDRLEKYRTWVQDEAKADPENKVKNSPVTDEFLIRSGEVIEKAKAAQAMKT